MMDCEGTYVPWACGRCPMMGRCPFKVGGER